MTVARACIALCLAGIAGVAPPPARAQEFSAVVSPPRFEDRVKPGETWRNVVEIVNAAAKPARYTVETADWTLDAQGAPVFARPLAPGSCRPWVGLEAAEVRLAGEGRRRFRFEVKVPADAPRGECRFALMIEGEPGVVRGGVPLPVSGRIGVIFYLVVGDAAPKLTVLETLRTDLQGQILPVLRVRNDGDAHGRLEGYLAGLDADGRRLVLIPDSGPILPGATRDLVLHPQAEDAASPPPAIAYPLRIHGRLDADRQRLDIDTRLAR